MNIFLLEMLRNERNHYNNSVAYCGSGSGPVDFKIIKYNLHSTRTSASKTD